MENPFKWRHYESEIILLCVRWYLRYALSSLLGGAPAVETRRHRGEQGDEVVHQFVLGLGFADYFHPASLTFQQ